MRKIQKILLGLIFVGLLLLATEKLWVPRLVSWILSREEAKVSAQIPETTKEIKLRLGQHGSALGLRLIPEEVLQDSRCPQGVQCVWAGSLLLRASLETEKGKTSEQFELGKPVAAGAYEVNLTQVQPEKSANNNIAVRDYLFVFHVIKR